MSKFSTYRQFFEEVTAVCREIGVEVQFSTMQHRSLGRQSLPSALLFSSRDIYLKFIDKEGEFEQFRHAWEAIYQSFPELRGYFSTHPLKLLEYPQKWPQLMQVCVFFMEHPQSGLYLRQLEIPGVDTKFIENHKKIISELTETLRSVRGAGSAGSVSPETFEERHGLRREPACLRFRVLDPDVSALFGGFDDLEVPLPSLVQKEIPCEMVFIVENKITGLCIPALAKSLVYFELGYKALLLKNIPWLRSKRLVYWGDLDTHGFSILSQLRQHFPQVQSLCMDQETLLDYRNLWTVEERPFPGPCPNLTATEAVVFEGLQNNLWGQNIRLEQERVPLSRFMRNLPQLLIRSDALI